MKNYWLNRANDICNKCGESYWPFNDENTLMQGDPMCACYRNSCNLDIFYPSRFIQNEMLQTLDKSKYGVTVYLTEFTPVIPGTMFGTIAFGGCDVFTFNFSENGTFFPKRIGDRLAMNLEEMAFSDLPIYTYFDTVYEAKLNVNTGELTLKWDGEMPVVTVCYEYNREIEDAPIA